VVNLDGETAADVAQTRAMADALERLAARYTARRERYKAKAEAEEGERTRLKALATAAAAEVAAAAEAEELRHHYHLHQTSGHAGGQAHEQRGGADQPALTWEQPPPPPPLAPGALDYAFAGGALYGVAYAQAAPLSARSAYAQAAPLSSRSAYAQTPPSARSAHGGGGDAPALGGQDVDRIIHLRLARPLDAVAYALDVHPNGAGTPRAAALHRDPYATDEPGRALHAASPRPSTAERRRQLHTGEALERSSSSRERLGSHAHSQGERSPSRRHHRRKGHGHRSGPQPADVHARREAPVTTLCDFLSGRAGGSAVHQHNRRGRERDHVAPRRPRVFQIDFFGLELRCVFPG